MKKIIMDIFARKRSYSNDRYKTDNKFCSLSRTESRIYQALGRKNKPSSTKDILGIDIETYRKWIEHQMTPEMN